MIKVRYIGEYYKVALENGTVYDAENVDDVWCRIFVDAFGDYFMFEKDQFEVIPA